MTTVLQQPVFTTTVSGSTTLTDFPPSIFLLGTAYGYSVLLPDATTLIQGGDWSDIWNVSLQPVLIKDNSGNLLFTLLNGSRLGVSLTNNSTRNGQWSFIAYPAGTAGNTLNDTLFSVIKPTVVLKSAMGAVAADKTFDSMAVFNGKLYLGTGNSTLATDATAAKVITYDGTTWSVITKATMGGVAGDIAMESMAVYNGKLYIGTYNATAATDSTSNKLLVFDGSTWSTITKATMGGVANDLYFVTMQVYNGALYIGGGNTTAATDSTAAKIFKFDGASWSTFTKATVGGVAADQYFQMMAVYNNILYIGTTNATAATDSTGAKIINYNGTTWAAVTKATMGAAAADLALQSMAVYSGKLYIGTANITAATDSTAAKLIVWDGTAWSIITKATMGGNTTDQGFETMAVYNGKLYVGEVNNTAAIDNTSAKLFQFDRMVWATINKSTLGWVNADTDTFFIAIFQNKMFLTSYNTTAATDSTGFKVSYFAYPIAENYNSYCSRGF